MPKQNKRKKRKPKEKKNFKKYKNKAKIKNNLKNIKLDENPIKKNLTEEDKIIFYEFSKQNLNTSSDEEDNEKDEINDEDLIKYGEENLGTFNKVVNDKKQNNNGQSLKEINNKNNNSLFKKEPVNKNIISPIGEINGKLVEFHTSFIIYEGFKYNITTRLVDIKKQYRNNKNYKIYSCQNRRKDEPIRKGQGNFCKAQILLDLSKTTTENLLINRNYRILSLHSSECIELNFNNIPMIKTDNEEKESFNNEIYHYLDKINFFNKK
jgi:hypothetical protein